MKKILSKLALSGALLYTVGCGTVQQQETSEYPKKALFSMSVLDSLQSYYDGAELEHLMCFEGKETQNSFIVDGLYEAKMKEQTSTRVSGSCRASDDYDVDTFLGSVHNHPVSKKCESSTTDLAWYMMGSRERVYGIVCQADVDEDRLEMLVKTKPYNWYNKGRDTTQKGRSILEYGMFYD